MLKRAGSRQIQLIRPGEKHLEYMTKRLGAVRGREVHKTTIIPISSVVNISASSAPGWSHKRKAALRASEIFQLECATDNHHLNANLFSSIINLPCLIWFMIFCSPVIIMIHNTSRAGHPTSVPDWVYLTQQNLTKVFFPFVSC